MLPPAHQQGGFTKELPVARRVGLSLTGLWRLAIWRVVLGLYLIEIEMWATSPIGFQSNVTRRMSHMRSRFPLRRRARTPLAYAGTGAR